MTAERNLYKPLRDRMEVERDRLPTEFNCRDMLFNKQYMREMLCRSRTGEDAPESRVHLQIEKRQIMAMNNSHEESAQGRWRDVKDLKTKGQS